MKTINTLIITALLIIGLCSCKDDSSNPIAPELNTCTLMTNYEIKQNNYTFYCRWASNLIDFECTVPYNADITQLWTNFQLCSGAKAYIGDKEYYTGLTIDYTNAPLTYRVVSEDGLNESYYKVTLFRQGTEAKLISFSLKIDSVMYDATIDQNAKTVTVNVPSAVTITEAYFYFEISPGASFAPTELFTARYNIKESGVYSSTILDNRKLSVLPEVDTIGDYEGDEPTEYTIHLNRT